MTIDFSKVLVSDVAGYKCVIRDTDNNTYDVELDVPIKPQAIEIDDEDEFIEWQAKQYCQENSIQFKSVDVEYFIDF